MKNIDWIDLYETIICNIFQKKYENVYAALSNFSSISYKLENIVRNNKFDNQLTKEQKKEIRDYWKKHIRFINYKNFNFYMNHSKVFSPKYISNEIFARYIEDYFNNLKMAPAFGDKNYFDLYLKGFKMPKTYIHCINGVFLNENYEIIDKQTAIEILMKYHSFVMKSTISTSMGEGVKIIDNITKEKLIDLITNLDGENYIFQEKITQSKLLSVFNESTVNIIRIFTYMIDDKVYTSSCKLRVGDNKSSVLGENVINFFVEEDGKISKDGFDSNGIFYDDLLYKYVGSEVYISQIEKIKQLVTSAAQKIPHYKLIGWDITIDEFEEPVIIEYNITSLAPDFLQLNGEPFFKENTDEVLNRVFTKTKKRKIGLNSDQYI